MTDQTSNEDIQFLSSEQGVPCSVCQAYLDDEDLFCANCGTEAPLHLQAEPVDSEMTTKSFDCNGCGASMSYDAGSRNLQCPFCGSEKIQQQDDQRTLRARRVLTFAIDDARAQSILRKWLGSGFWKPSDLVSQARVTKMTPVYVPYWVFEASTATFWTADSSKVPFGARGDWIPCFGNHHSHYRGVIVGASGALTSHETTSLCPFDISQAVDRHQVDLENAIVERMVVQRKYARPQARVTIEALEREACTKYVPGRSRNVKVNTRLHGMKSTPVLLPVWIMAYHYKGQLYRFLINGQTGRHIGKAPLSYVKLFIVITIIAVLILAILGCAGAFSVLAG